jgi:hypothetical protein
MEELRRLTSLLVHPLTMLGIQFLEHLDFVFFLDHGAPQCIILPAQLKNLLFEGRKDATSWLGLLTDMAEWVPLRGRLEWGDYFPGRHLVLGGLRRQGW